MCGIFGYVSSKPLSPEKVFSALKTLEYRGYDSWGIAAKLQESGSKNQEVRIKIEKETGKLPPSLHSPFSILQSPLAIGHTRWATHGGVTKQNAHPHMDCTGNLALVHNGIFENYETHKKDLVNKGHKFKSETDTEVIVHLIEEELKTKNFSSAVRETFRKMKGLNAFVVMNTKSDEIVTVKNGSPLIIGIGENQLFVSSDAAGIVTHTKKVIYMEDNQMAILGKNLEILDLLKGKSVKPKIKTLDWDFEKSEKGKYKHFLLKEIHDQKDSIKDALSQNEKDLLEFAKLIKKSFGTYIIGCGTAGHAARMATYIFSVVAKRHINFAIGSEFSYYKDFLTPKSLLIAASQSGETIDLVEAINAAREHKSKVASLVNVVGSTIYRESDLALPLRAGTEKAVISTKAFTSKLAIFYILAFILADKYKIGRRKILEASLEAGKLLSDKKLDTQIKKLVSKIARSQDIYILGRGLSFPLALEAAHKIKEASYIHAEGFAGGEPKHCEISLISKGTPSIFFVPNDETKSAILSNAAEFKSRGAFIIGISPEKNDVFDEWINVPDLGVVSPLVSIIPAQLLAYYLALKKGNDPDKPRNLAKSVTVK